MPKSKCPNCGSDEHRETLYSSECPNCGYRFVYSGTSPGGNRVHDEMMAARDHVAFCEEIKQDMERPREVEGII